MVCHLVLACPAFPGAPVAGDQPDVENWCSNGGSANKALVYMWLLYFSLIGSDVLLLSGCHCGLRKDDGKADYSFGWRREDLLL